MSAHSFYFLQSWHRQDANIDDLDENGFRYVDEHNAFFHSETKYWYVIVHKLFWSSEEDRWYSYDEAKDVWQKTKAPRQMAPGPWNATNPFKWGFINGKWYEGLIKHTRTSDGARLFYPDVNHQRPPVKQVWLLESCIKSDRPQKHIAKLTEVTVFEPESRKPNPQSKQKRSKQELLDLYHQEIRESQSSMGVQNPASQFQTLNEQISHMKEKLPGMVQSSPKPNKQTDSDKSNDVSDECELDSVGSSPELQAKPKSWNPQLNGKWYDVSYNLRPRQFEQTDGIPNSGGSSSKAAETNANKVAKFSKKADKPSEASNDAFSESEDEDEMSISKRLKNHKRVLEIDLTSPSGREKRSIKSIDVSGRKHARALRRLGTGRAPEYPNKTYPKPAKSENPETGLYFCPHCNFESHYHADACNHSDNCRNCGERYCLRIDCKNRSFKDKRRMKKGYHKKCGMWRDGPVIFPLSCGRLQS